MGEYVSTTGFLTMGIAVASSTHFSSYGIDSVYANTIGNVASVTFETSHGRSLYLG